MTNSRIYSFAAALFLAVGLAACSGNPFSRDDGSSVFSGAETPPNQEQEPRQMRLRDVIFAPDQTESATKVNRHIWQAALDVMEFLPVEQSDPFTGVIVFGYGTPPNGDVRYRATVRVTDPALDARSLSVSLMDETGLVDKALRREVENAILSRAREIRIAELNL